MEDLFPGLPLTDTVRGGPIGRRADRVLSRVARALPDGDVILVAHAHFLRVLTAR